jgi:hypothetical protein
MYYILYIICVYQSVQLRRVIYTLIANTWGAHHYYTIFTIICIFRQRDKLIIIVFLFISGHFVEVVDTLQTIEDKLDE